MLPRPAVLRPVHHLADVCSHLLPALVPHHQLPGFLGIHAHTIRHIVPATPFHHLNQTRRTMKYPDSCLPPAPTAHVDTLLADLVSKLLPTHAHFSSKAGDVLRHSGITCGQTGQCSPVEAHGPYDTPQHLLLPLLAHVLQQGAGGHTRHIPHLHTSIIRRSSRNIVKHCLGIPYIHDFHEHQCVAGAPHQCMHGNQAVGMFQRPELVSPAPSQTSNARTHTLPPLPHPVHTHTWLQLSPMPSDKLLVS